MRKLQRVPNSKYRVVISDVLPYERPVFFTNRYFARFLKYYGIRTQNGMLTATRHTDTEGLDLFLKMLGGKSGVARPGFQYSITKEGHSEGRNLMIIHPYHQVEMVEFYKRYKMLLIDFCQRSHFSIRYPYKVATYHKKQKSYDYLFSDDAEPVDPKEGLKHFFVYKYYKNINFFYEDYRYLRAEKQFRCMAKLDLYHCFESISPSMLSMAMFSQPMEHCKESMAYEFCRLQCQFKNKEGGIIIGPEFSRIYAEIILQRIDQNVEHDLKKQGIQRNIDYIFYRYVDDGFLFFDDIKIRTQFFYVYIKRLREFNLKLNKSKLIVFRDRPFLEGISSAKLHLMKLVDETFQNRLTTFRGFLNMQNNRIDTPIDIDYKHFVNEVRSILRSEGGLVRYKDITSFLLGIIQKHMLDLLSEFNVLYRQYSKAFVLGDINDEGMKIKERYEREFIAFCIKMVEILFFLLGCDIRISTSIKVVSVIDKLQMFVRGLYTINENEKSAKFPSQYVELLDNRISNEIASLLLNSKPCFYNMMEILNILELEKVMMRKNQIAPSVLTGFMTRGEALLNNLNFFIVFEVMHFIKDDTRYGELRAILYQWVNENIRQLAKTDVSDTEAVLTFIETMSCPWIETDMKNEFSKMLFGKRSNEVCRFIEKQKDIFVQWRNFSLNEAIQHTNSQEVY